MRDLFAEIENIYLMQLYQHIYVYKTMMKKFNPKLIMNPTVLVIFAQYCTYLLICCSIFSEWK